MYRYDICIHADDYYEKNNTEFVNPVHVGDFITDGVGNMEYEVFRIIHSSVGGGSAIHVRPPKENIRRETETEMNTEAHMTNEELQNYINQTSVIIKNTEPGAECMKHLNQHFLELLNIQKIRAAMVSISGA